MKRRRAESFTEAERKQPRVSDFKADLEIDPDDLDEGLITQPQLVWDVSEQLVLAIDRRDTLKLELENVEADEDNKIRALAEKHEDRITEPFIKKQIAAQPHIQRLKFDLRQATKRVGLWEAMKESIKQRSYALSNLVELTVNRSPNSRQYNASDRLADDTHRRLQEARPMKFKRR
jgi:hypothetical protein